jgi:uncharacterized protein YndB with AHSA1/START domain
MDPAFANATTIEDRVLTITRTFDAPRALVWRAFADPFHLSQWWGPKGYTNPVCELDFRVGGHWRNVMRSPGGEEYPADFTFLEIREPERIVFRNAAPKDDAVWQGNPPPSFVRTITFEGANGRTVLTMRAEFDSAEEFARAARRGFREGSEESLDRLAELMARQTREAP